MKDSFILAPGHPHELLGLLRRMPGIEDISLLLDSEGLLRAFRERYPENEICCGIMEEACKLGIISEMAGIINGPMWRKRSFINKSAIRIMAEKNIKEYQMCELLESMMQLFEWNFEIQIMRRWETSEEDSAEYNREHPRKVEGRGDARYANDTEIADGNQEVNDNGHGGDTDKTQEALPESPAGRNPHIHKSRGAAGNTERPRGTGREHHRPDDSGDGEKKSRPLRLSVSKKKKNFASVKYNYLDSNGMVTDIKGYIQNEIIKSGIRFESIMNNSVKRDVRRAINGNADAQYRMGSYYAEPDTKHTDYEEALKWYRVSASQGNKKAQFEIGMLYDGGKIKCTDYKKEAIKCYLALAEAGFPTAQCKLGMKYRLGDGVDEDINEAIKWFKRAATQGHTDAQRNLGDIYMAIGRAGEAMKWYGRAAAAGDNYSSRQLEKGKKI